MGEEQFGNYRLDRMLGRGGMGEVWLARDSATGRTVALKVLSENLPGDGEYRRRFEREARIGSQLRNPHIVRIHGFGEHDGRLFIAMEYIAGIDLAEMLSRVGTLNPDAAVDFIGQVASGLEAAHRAGLIHRDVKPSNILVGSGGHAYLIDFGIAKGLGQTAVTATGMAIGSWPYMAPERFNGTVDARSDIYSLACVLYECLTGRRPYGDTDPPRQMHDHLMATPPSAASVNPAVPAELDAVIAGGMAKDQAQRYRSAEEFAAAARVAVGSPQPPRPSAVGPWATAAAPGALPATVREPNQSQQNAQQPPTPHKPTKLLPQPNPSPTPAPPQAQSPGAAAVSTPEPLTPTKVAPESGAEPRMPTKVMRESGSGSAGEQSRSSGSQPPKSYVPTKVMSEPTPTPTLVATRIAPPQLSPTPARGAVAQQGWRAAPTRRPGPPPPAQRPAYAKRPRATAASRRRSPLRGRPWIAPTAPAVSRRGPRRRGGVLTKVIGALVVVFLTPFVLAAGCVALLASGSRSGAPDDGSAGPPPAATAEENPVPVDEPDIVAPAGTPVRDGKLEFVVTGVDSGLPRIGFQSARGTFMIVAITVRNIADGPKRFLPFGQRLIDTQNRRVDHDPAATMWQNTQQRDSYSFDLRPGESVTTQLVFDIAPDAAPDHLELHDFPISNGVRVMVN
ncbi:serine/threonine-protein kinase [Nocardia australiensis]|uniref:serine/threonine-protein kinase n=1 Tax=Nocardia australiensis TaxID=2887191 RepID=UPI001D137D5D|nr:serine/threonine-protein kinase [Nocardia australiensis]